jgi:anti-anti-sigma factor
MRSESTACLETAANYPEVNYPEVIVHAGPAVVIRGEIDICSSAQLREQLLSVMQRHGARIVLDLAEVTFIDCAGISALLAARRQALLAGGSLRVLRVLRVLRASPRVRRIISLTRLDPLLMPTALSEAAAS